MSTVSVANIHFESTGNNRIQLEGTNTSIYQAGQLMMTANSTEVTFNYNSNNIGLVNYVDSYNTGFVDENRIGDLVTLYVDAETVVPSELVEVNTVLLKSSYPNLLNVVGTNTVEDTSTWFQRVRANTNSQRAVAYGNGLFVSVGASGSIQTSTDGLTWTNRTRANTNQQNAVAYGNGVYVTVGVSGSITSSTDGITWTNRTTANTLTQSGITYGNGIFVAVGGDTFTGTVQTSTDGTTWTNRTVTSDRPLLAAAYGNGVYVAVGESGRIRSSTDGITWTARTSATGDIIYEVVYGDGIFVAVGGTVFTSVIQTSTDGTTWTRQNAAPASVETIYTVAYGNGKYVAAGDDDSSNPGLFQTSTDGVNWTQVTPANTLATTLGSTYGNGTFVVVGSQIQTTLAVETEFKIYPPYESTESYIKQYVRAV